MCQYPRGCPFWSETFSGQVVCPYPVKSEKKTDFLSRVVVGLEECNQEKTIA